MDILIFIIIICRIAWERHQEKKVAKSLGEPVFTFMNLGLFLIDSVKSSLKNIGNPKRR